MSTHNIDFYEDLTKIIFELSSNTHLISSADVRNDYETEKGRITQNQDKRDKSPIHTNR